MTFEQFAKILLKRWFLVAICFLCVGLGAFIGSSKLMKPVYQSTTLIEVIVHSGGDPLVNDNILASQQLTQTEASLATTEPVLSAVASRYPGLSADDLAKEVTASAKDNTQLIAIDVLDADPTRAANLANSVATTLISQQLEATQQKPPAQSFMIIAQPARPSTSPARPNKLIYVGAGLLIGLLLGMILAVIWELLDPRVHTKEALTQLLEWPLLGTLGRTSHKEDVINFVSYNSNTEAYGNLHAYIGLATRDRPLHTLAITSATPGDGKSVVATNLAVSIAKTGKSVLLIDANLRHPTLHEQFDISTDTRGFSNAIVAFKTSPFLDASTYQQVLTSDASTYQQVLTSKAYTVQTSKKGATDEPSLVPFIRSTDISNLYIMPSGPLPPYPPELLDSQAMQRLLVALSKSGADVIIFDMPALLGLADALILAPMVDSTIVVVDARRANKGYLQQTKAQLDKVGAHVSGYVLNKERRNHQKVPYAKYGYDARSHKEKQVEEVMNKAAASPLTPPPPQRENLSQPGLSNNGMSKAATPPLTPPPLRRENPSQPGLSNNGEKQATSDASVSPENTRNIKDQIVKSPTAGVRETGE